MVSSGLAAALGSLHLCDSPSAGTAGTVGHRTGQTGRQAGRQAGLIDFRSATLNHEGITDLRSAKENRAKRAGCTVYVS